MPPAEGTHLIAIVLSAAGLQPLRRVIADLPAHVPAAIVILQHLGDRSELPAILQASTSMSVTFAEHGAALRAETIYVCPPHRHALIRPTRTIALSDAPRIRHSRPSADWLLESAAASYRECATAVILSGRLSDGARGVVWIRRAGGHTIAQLPATCGFSSMPLAAIQTGCVDAVLAPGQIASALQIRVRCQASAASSREWHEPFADPD